jgi:hypothetical protein
MNSSRSDDCIRDSKVAQDPPEIPWLETGSSRVVVDLAVVSDRGLVRENNQDHFLVVRVTRSMERLLTNLREDHVPVRADEVGYGFVVADGMGGPAGGEVARSTGFSRPSPTSPGSVGMVRGYSISAARRRGGTTPVGSSPPRAAATSSG